MPIAEDGTWVPDSFYAKPATKPAAAKPASKPATKPASANLGVDVGTLARAVVDKVQKELPQMVLRSGTVRSYEPGGSAASVHLDGDPSDNDVSVTNVTGIALGSGSRILVLFSPPQGGYIIGNVGGNASPVGRIYYSGA